MANTETNNAYVSNTERAIRLMGLESYKPHEPKPLSIPENQAKEEVAALISASLEAGKDPAADPKIQKAIFRAGIAEHTFMIRTQHEHDESMRHIRNIKDQGTALVQEMKQKFEDAAAVLREAHKVIGAEPLWDQTAYYPAHDRNWPTRIKARAALDTTTVIIENWSNLIPALQGPLGIVAPIQHYANPTPEDHDHYGLALAGRRQEGGNTGVWDMLQMGITVDLATSNAEVRERVERINDARAKQEAVKARNAFR